MWWQNLQRIIGRKSKRYHTQTVLQMEVAECGAAALGIILAYYGRIVPLTELRQACGVSRDGVNALNVVKAAKTYGLSAKGYKKDLAALWHLKLPYIVFWNFNHLLVVEGLSKERVYLNDPATGRRSVSWQEFSDSYTGVVLVLEPGSGFQKGGRKPSTILSLWSRLQGSFDAIIYCVLAGFLQVIPGLAIPVFSQVFVDSVLIGGKNEWLRPLILGMILTAGLNGFLTLLQLQSLRQLKVKLSASMKSKFLWHILRLSISFYDQRFAGEISSRIQLNDSIANLLSGKLATSAIAAASIFLYVIVMLQYDVLLTLIAIAFVAVNLVTLQWVRRHRTDTNTKMMQEYGKVQGIAISGLQSIETLKASGLESDFFSRWAGNYTKAINTHQQLEVTNQTLGIVPTFLSASASLLMLAIGGLRVMDGAMSIGMLVAFQGMMHRFLEPVNNLVHLGSDLQEMEGNLNRLDDVLNNPIDPQLEPKKSSEHKEKKDLSSAPKLKLQGDVELRNVTFGYSQIASPIIENFNLCIKKGQRVALVGASGCGKSTITKLLCGLYEPWQGEIYFDGERREQIERQVLVNSISAVDQEIFFFAGSVKDNLTLWDSTIPNEDLVQACEDAQIHDVIVSLPGRYNADLLEGATNLSGGQRQRLEIARALVNHPSILILDEATSALDAKTEKQVSQNLKARGCTCIIVAHRLSTIQDCDEIIVIERGKIVQQGTHEQLQQIEGPYLQLIRSEQNLEFESSITPTAETNFADDSSISPTSLTKIDANKNPIQKIDAQLLRLESKERLERELMTQTLAELASVLQPRSDKVSNRSTLNKNLDLGDSQQALLVAAGAVGKALGIEIRPPAISEDSQEIKDSVEALARASCIRVRQIKLPNNWWRQDYGPILAYIAKTNLPVALLPTSNNRYQLYAPGEQTPVPVDARTAATLIPNAYIFYRPFSQKHPRAIDLLQFAFQRHYKELIVISGAGITATLLGMLTPFATAILIDKAIPDANRALLAQVAFGLVTATFGTTLFQLTQGLATIRLETFATSSIQAAVWDRLLNLKLSFFRSFSVGDLNSRVTAINQIHQRLGNTILKSILSSLFSLLNLGLLFYYNISLALLACAVAVINTAVTIIFGIAIVRKARSGLNYEGKIFGVVVQLINGVAKLRVAKAETRAFAYWGQQYTQQLKLMLSRQGIEDSLAAINEVLPTLTTAALFWFAASLIAQSHVSREPSLSTGTFLALNVAFNTFINAVTSLSNTVVEVLQVLPLWQRAKPILLAEPEITFNQADPGKLTGRLAIERVSFRYRNDCPLVLDKVIIQAQAGEFIAIVGPSGSGKSTLLRLLLGFEFPKLGKVYYDGQDLASVNIHAVRRQLGVVLQNSRLMSASILNNITSGAALTIDEAWEAARMAGLADDIAAMPMGMHTVVSEGGSNLSGGQRQRLLIARALALKPKILLFDEATSALDNTTQAIVSQSLDKLQVTRIVIAHRLSTIRNAHRIYVLKAGRVVQQGTFQELATMKGLFAQLMARQMA
ncbi:NHLP family bacteriocin export ABC transporter peptidase/permease/ATPase subunit [Dendronalium sp. ChiSLP03b]|uniref:NHLP family bacteriocin export ABC transporter peptidase/permease/ATPase subunit n=1 Tax=Dendronalium sp. ChiSLP03b TaxID=3075381 RepID=UPI002AD50102|nr:NHLP family bacteriocin export ABC transporter peptidase/permease/ATPase subunit [Dendronalium sp. ChiSLP03b]MDZ8207796.1 NHLP family bacteriocin export ABC transporter peptidase/permease/ATPase subunit [Dendronalium sp. ChiSLP03b]